MTQNMRKKNFIHVGLQKTATTFFQTKIFPFLRDTVCLSRPYTQENLAFNKLQYADNTLYNPQDIKSEIEKIESKQIIISDEQLSGIPNCNYINRSLIADRLSYVYPEAEIILFLRGQKDILLSLYNQAVKVGRTQLPINEYIYFPGAKNRSSLGGRYFNNWYLNIHPDHFLYYELIKMYFKKFARVHIFLYEEFRDNPVNVIKRILDILNENLNDNIDLLDPNFFLKPVNSKLSDRKLETIRYENLFRPILKTNNKFILKPMALTYEIISKLFTNNKSSSNNGLYVQNLIANYYYENNLKITENYPDIPIKKYPNAYQISR